MFHLGETVVIVNPTDSYAGQAGQVRGELKSLDPSPRWRVEFRPGTWGWYDDADLSRP